MQTYLSKKKDNVTPNVIFLTLGIIFTLIIILTYAITTLASTKDKTKKTFFLAFIVSVFGA